MNKRIPKYFINIYNQENWLNEMSKKGFRVVKTGKIFYRFVNCESSEYEYRVEFVADKSYNQLIDYIKFLEDMNYRILIKNMNINYSFGKIRIRPWAKGAGIIATSPGNFNKELLIIEKKKDNKPFEMHTEIEDLIGYYRIIRNTYLFEGFILIFLGFFGITTTDYFNSFALYVKIIIFMLGLVLIFISGRYSLFIHQYNKKRKIHEGI